jgi:hypothetical protein
LILIGSIGDLIDGHVVEIITSFLPLIEKQYVTLCVCAHILPLCSPSGPQQPWTDWLPQFQGSCLFLSTTTYKGKNLAETLDPSHPCLQIRRTALLQ